MILHELRLISPAHLKHIPSRGGLERAAFFIGKNNVTTLIEQITNIVRPQVEALGFELIQLKLMEGKKSRQLQIMAERPDGTISLDDCADISRQVSAVLDVEDIMTSAYRLEVSSPGIDRPLTREKDFLAYCGHTAKVETVLPIHGRRRFTGNIKGIDDGMVTLMVDNQAVFIPFRDIQSAKLVLTDELIKLHQKKAS